jgi:predicted nucleic acid-binding protein
MKIIIDTSVIIAVIANEPERDRLIEITDNATLLAPYSVFWEIGNAFSAMLKRKRINFRTAKQAIAIFHKIPIRLLNVELDESLKLADRYNCYCYDAYLLRCSQKYQSPLLTLDKKLFGIAHDMKLKVIEVL